MRGEVAIAWAAGLLEGEGSFSHKGSGTARNIVVNCHMTDHDVLLKLRRVLRGGYVRGPYRNGAVEAHWKPRYMYTACGPAAYIVMRQILPHMCTRRRARIRELLRGYDSVKLRVFKIVHLASGRVEKTTNLAAWLRAHHVSETGLYRTLVGQRNACKGWRRVA